MNLQELIDEAIKEAWKDGYLYAIDTQAEDHWGVGGLAQEYLENLRG